MKSRLINSSLCRFVVSIVVVNTILASVYLNSPQDGLTGFCCLVIAGLVNALVVGIEERVPEADANAPKS
jgi:multisubunit Na+/H+ antiporter MnhB subunit